MLAHFLFNVIFVLRQVSNVVLLLHIILEHKMAEQDLSLSF